MRGLERRIGEICRKSGKRDPRREKNRQSGITESNLSRYLGKERYHVEKGQ